MGSNPVLGRVVRKELPEERALSKDEAVQRWEGRVFRQRDQRVQRSWCKAALGGIAVDQGGERGSGVGRGGRMGRETVCALAMS